jgi:hypothetical protein
VNADKAGMARLVVDTVRAGGSVFAGEASVVARLAG